LHPGFLSQNRVVFDLNVPNEFEAEFESGEQSFESDHFHQIKEPAGFTPAIFAPSKVFRSK
jgi:hypothetical protein